MKVDLSGKDIVEEVSEIENLTTKYQTSFDMRLSVIGIVRLTLDWSSWLRQAVYFILNS